jgi:hypothetical protein
MVHIIIKITGQRDGTYLKIKTYPRKEGEKVHVI